MGRRRWNAVVLRPACGWCGGVGGGGWWFGVLAGWWCHIGDGTCAAACQTIFCTATGNSANAYHCTENLSITNNSRYSTTNYCKNTLIWLPLSFVILNVISTCVSRVGHVEGLVVIDGSEYWMLWWDSHSNSLLCNNTANSANAYYCTESSEKPHVLHMMNLEQFAIKWKFLHQKLTVYAKIGANGWNILSYIARSGYMSAGWCTVTQTDTPVSHLAEKMFLTLLNRQMGYLTHLIWIHGFFNLGCSFAAGVLSEVWKHRPSETSPELLQGHEPARINQQCY